MIDLILIPLFSFCDRYCGGGWPWSPKAWGRPIYYIAPGILFAGWVWHLEWVFIPWIIWRSLSWKFIWGASINPSSFDGFIALVLRHYILPIMAILSAYAVMLATNHPPAKMETISICLAVWAVLSAGIGLAWGTLGKGRDWNMWVELIRGGLFGLALFIGGLS